MTLVHFFRGCSGLLVCMTLFSGNILAADPISWLKLSEEARYSFVMGYNAGVSRGALDAAIISQSHYAPIDHAKSFKEEFNSPEEKKNWDDFNRIVDVVKKETGLRYSIEAIVEQMDFLYQDPAARAISWDSMIGIAQDRLDGKDVSGSINSMINANKVFLDMILQVDEPVFNSKKSK